MRLILSFVALLLASVLNAKNAVDLTLIPPGRITDQVNLDIRGGILNHSDSSGSYDIRIRIKGPGMDSTIVKDRKVIEGKGCAEISCKLDTKGLAGRYSVIFTVSKGLGIYRERREVTIIPSCRRSTGSIGGAWIGLYHWSETEGKHWNRDIRKLAADDWKGIVRSMHAAGMDIIVIQELFRNQLYAGGHDIDIKNYEGLAFYPSKLYPGRMDIACPDALEAIMDEADRLGMHVLPGIGMFAWFDFSKESLEWHKAVTEEVYRMYGHHKSFYGFYVSEEQFGSLDNGESDPERQKTRKDETVAFFKEYEQFCRNLAPSKPIMLATNSMQITKAEDTYHELLKHLDILCPFGFSRMPENDLSGKDAASLLQKWCDQAGSHLWMDLEAFLFDPDTSLYPRDIAGIVSDLTLFDNFEKVLCYQYPGVFNNPELHPLVGDKRGIKLYNDYKEYIKPLDDISLTLTPPACVTDKVDVDIVGGITNSTSKKDRVSISLSIRNNEDCKRLRKIRTCIDAGKSFKITHNLQTAGLCGKYEIVLKVRKGWKSSVMTRPLEIVPSGKCSYEILNGTWTGDMYLPDFKAEDWKGMVRSMDHIGIKCMIISEKFVDRNGNEAVQHIMNESDRLGMYVIHEIHNCSADISDAIRQAEKIIRSHGRNTSFYGLCLSGDITGIEKFKESIRRLMPACRIVVSTDKITEESICHADKADIVISMPNENIQFVSGNRLWLNVPLTDRSESEGSNATILSHMKNVPMMNISKLKSYLAAHDSYGMTIYGEYLGRIDNPSFHAVAGGEESTDFCVSYTAYSMYKEWLKPYSIPIGAKTVRNPKGILREDQKRNDYLSLEIDQMGDPRISERHWQAVPSVAADRDGSIVYMAWNAGGRDEEMGNYITISVSEDSGDTWDHDVMVIYPKNPKNTRILDPVLWRDDNDEIYIKFSVTMSDHGDQIDPMTSCHRMKISWSGDEMKFNAPEFLTYGLMVNPPTRIEGKDMTLYPICRCSMNHLNKMRYEENPEKGTYAYSLKNGIFRLYSVLPEVDYSLYDFEEHQFLCLDESGKELMCISRFRNGTNKCFSRDYGRTWSDFEPMPEIGPSTSSRACIFRLNSGKVMLIYNNAEDRSMMTVAISEDNGSTWPYKTVIDERPLTSYPAASQSEDGTIFVAYDRDRYNDMDIYFLRFSENDIIHNKTEKIFRQNLTHF